MTVCLYVHVASDERMLRLTCLASSDDASVQQRRVAVDVPVAPRPGPGVVQVQTLEEAAATAGLKAQGWASALDGDAPLYDSATALAMVTVHNPLTVNSLSRTASTLHLSGRGACF